MKWDHHKGLFRFETTDRVMFPPAGVFGLTLDGRLTIGFAAECYEDGPLPGEACSIIHGELTAADREEIAREMIARWLKWMVGDGFQGPCPNETHLDAIKVPGLNRSLCTCANADGGELSPETARLLQQGMEDALRGATTPIPVETTD